MYPKTTTEYLKVASVINSCTAIKQFVACHNMIALLERKHNCVYDSLRTMIQIKLAKIVGEYE